MSFIQNVRIASVPNGTSTISATGSKPSMMTPVQMNITSHDMITQMIANMKLNILIFPICSDSLRCHLSYSWCS